MTHAHKPIGIMLTAFAPDCAHLPSGHGDLIYFLFDKSPIEILNHICARLERTIGEIYLRSCEFETHIGAMQTKGDTPTKDNPPVLMAMIWQGLSFDELLDAQNTLKTHTKGTIS